MKTLFISPSYKCNEKCVFCPCATESDKYVSLSLDEAERALNRSIENAKIEMVLISGGEPTIWKDLIPFLAKVKESGMRIGILSNSTTFSVNNFTDKFIDAVGTEFELTTAFHSHMPEIHDGITRLKGSFAKSLRGVSNLIARGVKVTIKHVINNQTYTMLPDYAHWLDSTFPSVVPWVICNMDICGVARQNISLTGVPFDKSKPYLESALDVVAGDCPQRVVRVFNTPLCCIDPYYWKYLQKYDSEESMSALALPYASDADFNVRFDMIGDGGANFPPCGECVLHSACPGTWKNTAKIFGYDSFKPFK